MKNLLDSFHRFEQKFNHAHLPPGPHGGQFAPEDPMRDVPEVVLLARKIAAEAHAGQVDKAGEPYLTHPARVAYRVRAAGGPPEAEAAAWLHDVLEDTRITAEQLRKLGVPTSVITAVDSLTRRGGEPYDALIRRAKAHPLGRLVKKADIADNSDPERLARLDEKTRTRLAEKYAKAKALLES
ncbi:MAG: HD domain-containing protein [Marmoricola sp.]